MTLNKQCWLVLKNIYYLSSLIGDAVFVAYKNSLQRVQLFKLILHRLDCGEPFSSPYTVCSMLLLLALVKGGQNHDSPLLFSAPPFIKVQERTSGLTWLMTFSWLSNSSSRGSAVGARSGSSLCGLCVTASRTPATTPTGDGDAPVDGEVCAPWSGSCASSPLSAQQRSSSRSGRHISRENQLRTVDKGGPSQDWLKRSNSGAHEVLNENTHSPPQRRLGRRAIALQRLINASWRKLDEPGLRLI